MTNDNVVYGHIYRYYDITGSSQVILRMKKLLKLYHVIGLV